MKQGTRRLQIRCVNVRRTLRAKDLAYLVVIAVVFIVIASVLVVAKQVSLPSIG
jgi:hypothetical protein